MRGLRALLVDGLSDARTAIRSMLVAMGFRVDTATSPEEADERIADAAREGDAHAVILIDGQTSGRAGSASAQHWLDRLGLSASFLVLLTTVDDEQHWQQAHAAEFATVLLKPVSPSTLADALTPLLLGAKAQTAHSSANSHAESALRISHTGDRVLVAEDNPINQEVAVELLKGVGLIVDVAATGLEAVAMAGRNAYSLVLMDIQMPEMDGLAATRAIRDTLGLHDLPILAMTANAFGEDRAACLAAGMNDHIAKPVDPEALFATLLRWMPARGAHPLAAPVAFTLAGAQLPNLPAGIDAIAGLDTTLGVTRIGGKTDAYLRLLAQFAEHYREGLGAIETDHTSGNRDQARRIAHSLKGAAGTIGATMLQELAAALEAAIASAAPARETAAKAEAVDACLRRLVDALHAVLPTDHDAIPTAFDPDAVESTLDRLETLLAAADFDVGATFRAASSLLRAALGDAVAAFEAPMRNHDYPAALEALRAVRARRSTKSPREPA
jgi:CheY-like chemotaxis protein